MEGSFKKYLVPATRAHLIGIGGVSMSALAQVLASRGLTVTGSDTVRSDAVIKLENLGIRVAIGHTAENADECDCVVRTAAVKDDNAEVVRAKERGVPVFERAEAWGELMKEYRHALCIAGTHGKTTTSSMCAQIYMEAGLDPTVMIGGRLPLLDSGYRVGGGDTIIAESCEYCNSFHKFFPTTAVINNVESDHLDFFKDLEDIKSSFVTFAELVPEGGNIIVNADDEGAADVASRLASRVVTFAFEKNADVKGDDLVFTNGRAEFDVSYNGNHYAHIKLSVPGSHNAYNALAACAACAVLGVDAAAVEKALYEFGGADRRLQFKGKCAGADVYDDYAHHPGELKALLDTVEQMGYERIICVFQPHTYSRTKALFNEFVTQLRRADLCVLAEIYAAREQNRFGVSSADLGWQIKNSKYLPEFSQIEEFLKKECRPNDVILTVGAGNIYLVGEHICD